MKGLSVIFLFATIAVSCLSSCDFIRSVAGRPSTAEIEILRVEEKARIEEQAAVRAADSLCKASADAYDAFLKEGVKIRKTSEIPALDGQQFEKGLYLALGTFSMDNNALKLVSKASSSGYDARTIAYSNGFLLVVAIPSPDYARLRDGFLKICKEQFFPADAWILECE